MHEDIHLEPNKSVLEIQAQNLTLVQANYQSLHDRYTDINQLPY